MIVELMQCDECKNTHDTRNPIPASWIKVTQAEQLILHFCSDVCLLHHVNSRAYIDLPMPKPQLEASTSKIRRFLLVDGETAEETEGVRFSSGHVTVDFDKDHFPQLFTSWDDLKEVQYGDGVTWIDQEVSDGG